VKQVHAKVRQYLESWKGKGYLEDIPDEVPDVLSELNKAPSYKAIAVAILKNDPSLRSLGFTPKVSVYYKELKRIEIEGRKVA